MIVYLLISTVVLTIIFGLIHSQPARENLHLQTFYEWSVETLKYYLQASGLLTNQNNYNDNGLIEILDIAPDENEIPNLMRTQSSESIEEFQDIKVGDDDSIGSSNDFLKNQQMKNNSTVLTIEGHEQIFEAINSSLKKLSATANSVKANGSELYNLILNDVLLHHKAMLNPNRSETTSVQGPSSEAIVEVKEVEAQANNEPKKPKLYFGESPLEYVSHQKKI